MTCLVAEEKRVESASVYFCMISQTFLREKSLVNREAQFVCVLFGIGILYGVQQVQHTPYQCRSKRKAELARDGCFGKPLKHMYHLKALSSGNFSSGNYSSEQVGFRRDVEQRIILVITL